MTDDAGGDDAFESGWEAAAEWGRASVALGTALAVLGPLCMGLVIAVERTGVGMTPHRGVGPWVVVVSGYAAALMMLGFAAAGVGFGARSVRAARRHRQPAARGVAGVMLNAFAAFAHLGVGAAWTGAVLRWM